MANLSVEIVVHFIQRVILADVRVQSTPQTSNLAQMSKEQFDENALYQFALDVNQFGHEVAAEILIRTMKAWANEAGKSPETTQ